MSSLWLSHPTGNTFVRALLRGLREENWDYHFFSTLAFSHRAWMEMLPENLSAEILRRAYEVSPKRLTTRPLREGLRLSAERLGRRGAIARGRFSTDAVYADLDRSVAKLLSRSAAPPETIYAYEDGALETFQAAARRGARRVYDLPITYWETSRAILTEEAARWPEWEPTLGATRERERKHERKTCEIELAEIVVCPSQFVHDSLPASIRAEKQCAVVPFGSPEPVKRPVREKGKLRVLFAGQMSQRKGLADVFAAMKLLGRSDVELVVLGTPLLSMEFYRRASPNFIYEAPRHHRGVLEVMSRCDVLVLPSLLEGRALVQQEALACGLPLIVTENAGGADLIEHGKTGFLVPIRSPEKIAERIDWFASHRERLEFMRADCQAMAARFTWQNYARRILDLAGCRTSAPAS